MKALPVSALIIARNEERAISRCLASLPWAGEIVLVDGGSADRTREKAHSGPWTDRLRWIDRPWKGFLDQRNFALDQARHDWIFVIDADEEASPELGQRIAGMLETGSAPPLPAYKVRRVEYFLGREIRHGIWNPSYQDRFFRKTGVRYRNEVHEYPVFASRPGIIEEPIHHWPEFGPVKFLEKMNTYTTLEARDRYDTGTRTNWFRLAGAFPAMFLKNYFYYGAFKDGFHGFVISLLEGVSRVVRHVKIWQIQLERASRTGGAQR